MRFSSACFLVTKSLALRSCSWSCCAKRAVSFAALSEPPPDGAACPSPRTSIGFIFVSAAATTFCCCVSNMRRRAVCATVRFPRIGAAPPVSSNKSFLARALAIAVDCVPPLSKLAILCIPWAARLIMPDSLAASQLNGGVRDLTIAPPKSPMAFPRSLDALPSISMPVAGFLTA